MTDLTAHEARPEAIARASIEWYVAGLRDMLKGIPVRNFDEAREAYNAALDTLSDLAAALATVEQMRSPEVLNACRTVLACAESNAAFGRANGIALEAALVLAAAVPDPQEPRDALAHIGAAVA